MEESSATPQFLFVQKDDGEVSFINIGQMRFIEALSANHCRVTFDPNFSLEFHGDGAKKLIAFCLPRSITLDDVPVIEIMQKWMAEHPTSE